MKLFIITILITTIGCRSESKDDSQFKKREIDTTVRVETKIFGDSLKIVYKYCGDTVIQHRIDLKGTSDDDFDNSFTVKSVWSTKYGTDLKCSQKLQLYHGGYNFTYCLNSVIQKIESDIENSKEKPWAMEGLHELKNELMEIKSEQADSLSMVSYYLIFDLLRNVDFSIYETETKNNIEKVLIEQYITDFSGGRNYHLIDRKNDTVALFQINEWMR